MRIVLLSAIAGFLFCHVSHASNAPTSKVMNPDVSVNILGLFQNGSDYSDDRTMDPHNGFDIQESEIQFTSDVDSYLKANVVIAIAQEEGETVVEPEEVYIETLSLPMVTLRGGKFKSAVGKHNTLHAHAFPFIDAPLINQALLGEEGLNETGVSAAVLFPTSWYSEVTLQVISLNNEALYASEKSGDMGGVLHFKNLWDLNDDLTLEIGASATSGKNSLDRTSNVFGGDATLKWRPSVGGKYHALIWSTEYLQGDRNGFVDGTTGESTERLGGIATWFQYQFAERWWAQARYEYLGLDSAEAIPFQTKQSVLLGFIPTEFSGYRLQYDRRTTQGIDGAENAVALQFNITIGAHPAHNY